MIKEFAIYPVSQVLIHDGEQIKTKYSIPKALPQNVSMIHWKCKNGGSFYRLSTDSENVPLEETQENYQKWVAPFVTLYERVRPDKELEQAKAERTEAVKAIKVKVDGMMFDGDEVAQSRMTRAITAAETAGLTQTTWVLADNTVATVTKEQLKQALSKAMLMMSDLWTAPYKDQKE